MFGTAEAVLSVDLCFIIFTLLLINFRWVFIFIQRVGCDLRIGSSKKVDVCGVCGGNGSTCSLPLYNWDLEHSQCNVPCGGGKSIY